MALKVLMVEKYFCTTCKDVFDTREEYYRHEKECDIRGRQRELRKTCRHPNRCATVITNDSGSITHWWCPDCADHIRVAASD